MAKESKPPVHPEFRKDHTVNFNCVDCECDNLLTYGQYENNQDENKIISVFCPVCCVWASNISARSVQTLRAFEDAELPERDKQIRIWQHIGAEIGHPDFDWVTILKTKMTCLECRTEYMATCNQSADAREKSFPIKCPKCGKFCLHLPAIQEPMIEQL